MCEKVFNRRVVWPRMSTAKGDGGEVDSDATGAPSGPSSHSELDVEHGVYSWTRVRTVCGVHSIFP